MKRIKRWTIALFVLTMGLALTACSGQNAGEEALQNEPMAPFDTLRQPQASQGKESSEENGRILVAYFSATGNTEAVAQIIADQLEADLLEIVPAQPYTEADLNYTDDACRANREQNDPNTRPEIATTLDNIENYDVVLLGFPIWWGQEPRILDTFVESYDLSNKTVAAFCTSGSSGIGTAESNLQKLSGMQVNWAGSHRFAQGADESAVTDWLSTFDFAKDK